MQPRNNVRRRLMTLNPVVLSAPTSITTNGINTPEMGANALLKNIPTTLIKPNFRMKPTAFI